MPSPLMMMMMMMMMKNISHQHCLVKGFGSNQLMDVLNEGVHIRVREVGLS
jgi:hypothetical protein